MKKSYKTEVQALIEARVNKEGSGTETEDLIAKIAEENKKANPETELDKKTIAKAVEYLMFEIIRADVIGKKKRVDGRKMDEIREIVTEKLDFFQELMAQLFFQEGITQALSIVTLGSPRMEQLIESAEGEETKDIYIIIQDYHILLVRQEELSVLRDVKKGTEPWLKKLYFQ